MSDREDEPLRLRALPPWVYAVIGGVIAVVVVLVATVIVLASRSDVSTPKAKPATPTKTFEVDGRLDLISASIDGKEGGDCHGSGGFSDVMQGAQVVISNSAAKSIGVGEIDSTSKLSSIRCMFVFSVPNVPIQPDDIYSIQISHRDGISFHRADASNLELTLGDD